MIETAPKYTEDPIVFRVLIVPDDPIVLIAPLWVIKFALFPPFGGIVEIVEMVEMVEIVETVETGEAVKADS